MSSMTADTTPDKSLVKLGLVGYRIEQAAEMINNSIHQTDYFYPNGML